MLIRKHMYYGDLDLITLFLDMIMSLYVINLDDISLFPNSSFSFLTILNLYMIYLSI
jgi:hypothetical protein